MTEVLRIGNRTITNDELIPLLAGYQMLPQLRRELIIDDAIASIDCTRKKSLLLNNSFSLKDS